MELVICVAEVDDDLRNKYVDAAANHNHNMENGIFPDSGFDLFSPHFTPCTTNQVHRVNFRVSCRANMVTEAGRVFPTGFYLYPRSSLSKTSLRLANSVGIIDSGYRGPLIGAFDCIGYNYTVQLYDKLVQICAPGLVPIYVHVVFDESELGEETVRGAGGFGSTGR